MKDNVKLYKCYKATCNRCLDEENPYFTEDEYKALLDANGKVQCPEGHVECGIQELKPEDYPTPPKDHKKLFLIGGSLTVVLIIAGGVLLFKGKDKFDSPIGPNDKTVVISEKETHVEQPAVGVGENTSVKDLTGNKAEPEGVETNTPVSQGKAKVVNTLQFPFGYYKGETLNGLMHGIGTLYFTDSQVISSKDPKKRIAEAGDNVNGTWYQGFLDVGKWYSKSGEIKGVINIGH